MVKTGYWKAPLGIIWVPHVFSFAPITQQHSSLPPPGRWLLSPASSRHKATASGSMGPMLWLLWKCVLGHITLQKWGIRCSDKMHTFCFQLLDPGSRYSFSWGHRTIQWSLIWYCDLQGGNSSHWVLLQIGTSAAPSADHLNFLAGQQALGGVNQISMNIMAMGSPQTSSVGKWICPPTTSFYEAKEAATFIPGFHLPVTQLVRAC